MENSNKIITLKNVSKVYDGVTVVEDFNLEISLEDSFGETAVNAVESI